MIKYVDVCLMYKIIYGLTSPPLRQFVNIRTTAYGFTRGAARGDCIIPLRKSTFSQSAFSVRAALEWNSIPATIRELDTYSSFRAHLKKWLISTQLCQHYNLIAPYCPQSVCAELPLLSAVTCCYLAMASLPSCNCMHVLLWSCHYWVRLIYVFYSVYCACFLCWCFCFACFS